VDVEGSLWPNVKNVLSFYLYIRKYPFQCVVVIKRKSVLFLGTKGHTILINEMNIRDLCTKNYYGQFL